VIGNDAYSGAWPRLSNAVKDARLIAAALEAKGFSVTLQTNLNSRDMEEALKTFFYETGQDPGARLFLWYAGHGHSEGREGYLVPIDAPDPSETAVFLRKALSLRRMGEFVRGAKALHILSVFDSCFAGTIFNVGRAKPPPAITRATTRPVVQFLTSGDAGQEVSDDGTFRKLFIRALNGEVRADANGDGYLAASELGLFMTNTISNYSNGNQTPRNGKLNDPDLDQGDFIFQISSLAPRAAADAGCNSGGAAEQLFWTSIKDSDDAESYKVYLDQYPNGLFAALARLRIKKLTPKTAAIRRVEDPAPVKAAPAPKPTPAPAPAPAPSKVATVAPAQSINGQWSATMAFDDPHDRLDRTSCQFSLEVKERKFSQTIDDCGTLNGNYATSLSSKRAWLTGILNADGTVKSASLSFTTRRYGLKGDWKSMQGKEQAFGKSSVSITVKRQ